MEKTKNLGILKEFTAGFWLIKMSRWTGSAKRVSQPLSRQNASKFTPNSSTCGTQKPLVFPYISKSTYVPTGTMCTVTFPTPCCRIHGKILSVWRKTRLSEKNGQEMECYGRWYKTLRGHKPTRQHWTCHNWLLYQYPEIISYSLKARPAIRS